MKKLLDKYNKIIEPEEKYFKVQKQFYFYDVDDDKPDEKPLKVTKTNNTTTATKVKQLFDSF